jgi:hypothetical protein
MMRSFFLTRVMGCVILVVASTSYAQELDVQTFEAPDSWRVSVGATRRSEQVPLEKNQEQVARFNSALIGEPLGPEAQGFFQESSASTVFSPPAKLTERPGVQILNAREKVTKESEKKEKAPKRSLPSLPQLQPSKEDEKKSEREKLLAEYGDPTKNAPILATKDAPAPMRAMFQAIQSGQEDLAYQYARQYARYLRDLTARSNQIGELTGIAMEEEGTAPRRPLSEEPNYEGTGDLVAKQLKDEKDRARSYESALNEEALSILRRAEAQEDARLAERRDEPQSEVVPPQLVDEATERRNARERFLRTAPRSADGRLTVYLFARPYQTESREMLRSFVKLVDAFKDNKKIAFVILTAERQENLELQRMREAVGGKVPVRSGGNLRTKLGISTAPAVVFWVPGTTKIVVEEGIRSFPVMEEGIKVITNVPEDKKV